MSFIPFVPNQVLTADELNAAFTAVSGVTSFNSRVGDITLQSSDVTGALGFTPYNSSNPSLYQTASQVQTSLAPYALTSSLGSYATLASPTFTGVPLAPTATAGTNTTQLATTAFVTAAVAAAGVAGVTSFNTRTGVVSLTSGDVTTALTFTPYNATNPSGYQTAAQVATSLTGYATLASPTFTGVPIVPNAAPGTNTTQAANTAFVTTAVAASVVTFNTRAGAVTLSSSDVTTALGFTPYNSTNPTGFQTASQVTTALGPYALLVSPTFSGTPLGPTAAPGTNTTQLATTAFVTAAVSAATTGVASFNGRTGTVVLSSSDVTTALTFTPYNSSNPSGYQTSANVATALTPYAPLASPSLTGTPIAPTATAGTNTTQIATTAFVTAAVAAAGVTSFNTRTGAVTLTSSDVTTALTFTPYNATNPSGYQTAAQVTTALGAYAPLASPSLTGVPIAPTASAGASTTQIATTAFATAADSLKANLASPTLTGTPTAPTAAALTNSTQIASTAYTDAAVGVETTNRSSADALKANIASPTLTGTPAAPTATPGTATTQIATTAFVSAAVSAAGVSSFNTRTGAVTLTSADVTTALTFTPYNATNPSGFQTAANVTTTLAAYATLASPTFTGAPLAPTATAGTNTTQIASTAFVTAAAALKANIASPTFTGTVAAPVLGVTTSLSTPQYINTGVLSSTPTTGGTITMVITTSEYRILGASTLAALTIKLPASPADGQTISITTTPAVTALTIQNSAGTTTGIVTAPTAFAAGGRMYAVWNASASAWWCSYAASTGGGGLTIGTTTGTAGDGGILNVINTTYIYAKNHGIVANGSTDDTTAWAALFTSVGSTPTTFMMPPGISITSATITLPSYCNIIGCVDRTYDAAPAGASTFKNTTSSTTLLQVGTSCNVQGVAFWGGGEGGSQSGCHNGTANQFLWVSDCNFFNLGTGVDCDYAPTIIYNNQFQNVNNAIVNGTDSRFSNNFINGNSGAGIYQSPGANDSIISNNKIEFNAGYGLNIYTASSCMLTSNICDRSGQSNIAMVLATSSAITGNLLKRGSANVTPGTTSDVHILFTNNTECTITGNTTATGTNDDGGGYNSPAYSLGLGSNAGCTIVGNSFIAITGPFQANTDTTTLIRDNFGLPDIVPGTLVTLSSTYTVTSTTTVVRVANGSGITCTITLPTQYQGRQFQLAVGAGAVTATFSPTVLGYTNATSTGTNIAVNIVSDGTNWHKQ